MPTIVILDDDIAVLNAIERDLRSYYKSEYRILKLIMQNPDSVLKSLHELKARNVAISMFIVDQRMPGLTGIEFLSVAKDLFPSAKKCLLTAYADTEVAINGINEIDLDYYFMKPWQNEHFFSVLDDLLNTWSKDHLIESFEGIRVAGNMWSPLCHLVKDFLARNNISYLWYDIDKRSDIKILVKEVSPKLEVPVVFFPDGDTLIAPSIQDLAQKCGLKTSPSEKFYDLIVVGAGPAGLAAGVYGASEGLKTLVIDKEATGGQAGTSSRIENYLGFPSGISGSELANRATMQVKRLGAELIFQEVVNITTNVPIHTIKTVELRDGTKLTSYAVIIATGVSVNKFDIPGITELSGAGVFYGAALTEAQNFRSKPVFVLGGGNSAGQGAMFFSRYASQVTIVIRRDSLVETMSHYLIKQLEDTNNIEIWNNTIITEAIGKGMLERLIVKNNKTNEIKEVDASALFIFIGAKPFTDMVKDLVARDEYGYILTGFDIGDNNNWPLERDPLLFETTIPGIFASGDVRFGSSKRVAAAVGEGSVAVRLVHEYLKTI